MSNYHKERYMPVYWYATLSYCLPFLSAFTFYLSDVSFYWMMNFILSEFLLYVLVGFYPAIILSAIGVISSFMLFAYTGYQPVLQVNDSAQELTMVCATCAMAVLYFLRQKSNMHEANVHSKLVYSSAIANEVRDPMSDADKMADVVLRAFAGNKSPSKIDDTDFEYIAKYASELKDSSARALSKIDRILTSIRVDISSADDTAMHDIDACVARALRSVLQKDRARIHVNTDRSFKFYGSSHFLSYAIANIIDNALRYSGENTKIEIWYDSHTLHIRDNGVGIPEDQLPYIFNAFDKSGSERGTGVGLAFCQRVMENLNGSIECYSKVGEYTEFVLKFSV